MLNKRTCQSRQQASLWEMNLGVSAVIQAEKFSWHIEFMPPHYMPTSETSIGDSHFASLPSTEEAKKKIQLQTSSVLCIFFYFSELKCFPRSPTLYIHSSISLHLVGPTCLSLICLPCTIFHFFPLSVNYLLAYYTPSPIPPSIALGPFFPLSFSYTFITCSVLSLLHHILTSCTSTLPFFSSFFFPSKSNSLFLLITILWKKQKRKSTDLNRQINHRVIASSFLRSRLATD